MELKEKNVIITGATSGIGYEVAQMFARGGATLILPVRNIKEGNIARQNLLAIAPYAKIDIFLCDLASLSSIRDFAREARAHYEHIDVLINNAGVFPQELMLSKDGYELNFAVNYLAPVLLTHELMDLLKKGSGSRIVNVASSMYRESMIDFGSFHGEHFDRYKSYAQSKLALILFTKSFAKELGGANVTVNALHPGVIKTKLAMGPLKFTNVILRKIFMFQMEKPADGARRVFYLATSPDVEGVNGEYFEKNKIINLAPIIIDDETTTRLEGETVEILDLTK